jgi:hypothetical protein
MLLQIACGVVLVVTLGPLLVMAGFLLLVAFGGSDFRTQEGWYRPR